MVDQRVPAYRRRMLLAFLGARLGDRAQRRMDRGTGVVLLGAAGALAASRP